MKKKKFKKEIEKLWRAVYELQRKAHTTSRPVEWLRYRDLPALRPLAEGANPSKASALSDSERLNAIEKATEIRLTPQQREAVLSTEPPDFTAWGRASGKTTAACIWTLLHRKEPITWEEEKRLIFDPDSPESIENLLIDKKFFVNKRAIPDKDGYKTYATFRFLQDRYLELKLKCLRHGIQTCPVYYTSMKKLKE